MIDVSLLICTRDRGASLDRTLRSVTDASPCAGAVEVILVDNGSRDDTAARIAAWQADQPFAVTLVQEPQTGLARARNAGLRRARGRIVAMTDDDCVLDRGFFDMLLRCFDAAPAPAIIGGRILLGDPADLPVTIKLEDFAIVAGTSDFPGGFIMGANLAFTRDVVDSIGLFDERFGAGAPFRAAEDTDFIFRAQAYGITVRYDPNFVVRHYHGRRNETELRDLLAGYAFGDGALYAKHALDRRTIRIILRDLREIFCEIFSKIQLFPSIRYFHCFRMWNIGKGFLFYHTRRWKMDGC